MSIKTTHNIVKSVELKGELSKEQKRFNTYIEKIKLLKEQIETSREIALELAGLVQKDVLPVKKKLFDVWKTLIIDLDRSLFVSSLTRKQSEDYEDIVLGEADSFLAENGADEDIKIIFDKYSEETYDEIKEESAEATKEFIAQMFERKYGIDVDPEDIEDVKNPFNNPKFFEKLKEAQAKYDTEEELKRQKKAEANAQRPKSEKQIQKEQNQKAAESVISKTTKQIYVDLVKNFHPDIELDEAKKQWKTEIMQQITVAYDENDYIKLLELQMTLLENRENVLQTFDNKMLRHFNSILQQQVKDLEIELYMSSPEMNPMFPGGHLFNHNRNQMLQNVKRYIRETGQAMKPYKDAIEYIKTLKGFKAFINVNRMSRMNQFDGFDMF